MVWLNEIIVWLGGIEYAIFWGVLLCVILLTLRLLAKLFKGVHCLRKQANEKRERRKTATRRLEFTLPERENRYLRARLHTTLKTEELETDDKRSAAVRLQYARQMLARLKESPLSPVERLDVEEIASLIALYGGRERWSSSEIKAVNELLAKLLKLSAKYEIAV